HRLVEDHQLRLCHADAGKLDESLRAPAQVAGTLVAERHQAELLQDLASLGQLAGRCLTLGLPQPKDAAPEGFARLIPASQYHVLHYCEAGALARGLEVSQQ